MVARTASRFACWALLAAFAVLAFGAAPAAAAPSNDDRAAAAPLTLPGQASGTTVGATQEADEPPSCSSAIGGTVWYAMTPGATDSVVLDLDAAGDMDAQLQVFQRTRSRLSPGACAETGGDGHLALETTLVAGVHYLIRIAPLADSPQDAFTLQARRVAPSATPPGRRLPARGVRPTLERPANPDDAWAVRMRTGRAYVVNLVQPRHAACVSASLYPPGTRSFGPAPARSFSCAGAAIVAPRPGQGGRWSLHVTTTPGQSGPVPYRLLVVPAKRDDTAPGHFLRNGARVRGRLHGVHADVVDLYRFDVTHRSTLDLRLRTTHRFDLLLLGARGRQLGGACACGEGGDQQISGRVGAGRYFAAVRAEPGAGGRYALSRLSRTITATRVLIAGHRHAQAPPGRTVTVAVRVTPAVSGPATVDVERFDPLAGWLFYRRVAVPVLHGRGTTRFLPPFVGRWRAIATYDGTRRSAPSGPARAQLTVAGPLRE